MTEMEKKILNQNSKTKIDLTFDMVHYLILKCSILFLVIYGIIFSYLFLQIKIVF